jgi:hypothetical protein
MPSLICKHEFNLSTALRGVQCRQQGRPQLYSSKPSLLAQLSTVRVHPQVWHVRISKAVVTVALRGLKSPSCDTSSDAKPKSSSSTFRYINSTVYLLDVSGAPTGILSEPSDPMSENVDAMGSLLLRYPDFKGTLSAGAAGCGHSGMHACHAPGGRFCGTCWLHDC